jgi:hypothetical protein
MNAKKNQRPAQHQDGQPGEQTEMRPEPLTIRDSYAGSAKLEGKRALVTGGDSGIGRAIAVHFAREGADVAIAYLEEDEDARETQRLVEAEGRRCLLMPGDLSLPGAAAEAVEQAAQRLGASTSWSTTSPSSIRSRIPRSLRKNRSQRRSTPMC